ncbi:Ig-like domain-containing protein [Arthrobacter sp. USHLN218]|uniref:Ig-like domain-containing protein n=1 Tax=Arthrobacter sp. USHLN218 TaxID=3081232 RepID=UPI00301646EB
MRTFSTKRGIGSGRGGNAARSRTGDSESGEAPPPGTGKGRLVPSIAAAAMLAAALGPMGAVPASADVAAVGPVDAQNGFPTWYSDGSVKLQLCYMAGAGCLAEPPNPAAPASYPDNFPEEAFWFAAEASGGNLGLYEAALEAAHVNGPVAPGEQMGFGRLRFILNNLKPNTAYTITHPYGVNTITSEPDPKNAALGRIKTTIDSGVCAPTPLVPCNWAGVGAAFLGDYAVGTTASFLRQTGAAPSTLGDINTPRPVTGAPSGTNAVVVTGPDAGGPGINTLTVDTFTVQGLIFNGDDGAPSAPDLATASDSGRSATDNITKVTTPVFTGSIPGAPNAAGTVELMIDGAATPAASAPLAAGAYSLQSAAALVPGVHRAQARIANPAAATDPAAPPFLVSPTLTFTVDTTAPVASVVAPFPSTPTLDNTPTLNYTANEAAQFECRLLPSNAAWDPGCTSPMTYDAQVNGTYMFGVRATDAAGNVGAEASRAVRIGPADTAAPTVSARGPASAATNVAANANVTATFSEFMQGVTGTTFTLRNAAGTVIPATVTYDQATKRATLNPTANLAPSTTYTARLTGGASAIRDTANIALASTSWTFTTGAAPTVTARTPGSNGTAVASAGNLTATFSKAVAGVSGTTFTLKNAAGTAVPGVVSYNATTRVATLDPSASLPADTRYTATLTGGATAIRDTGGTPLASTSWSFTTGPAPTITTRTPASGATGVRRANNITATFSEAVQGVTASTFTLRNASTGAAVSAVVSRNGTTNQWILNPGVTLASNTRYTVTITGSTTAARDLAGNPAATSSWSFTTGTL